MITVDTEALVEAVARRVVELLDERPGEPEWLTIPEAAEYLRCSTRSLSELLDTGKIRSYRPAGTRTLVRRSDLEAYITNHHRRESR